MRKILFILLPIIFTTCSFKKPRSEKKYLLENTKYLSIKPEPFIQKLPAQLAENSGIIFYDNLIWTFNDSSGKNKIYGLNKSGKIIKEIEVEEAKNIDWEDITQDKKNIYIGDFGNNSGNRKNQKIYKIKKKDIGKKNKKKVKSSEIKFDFTDQESFRFQRNSTPFDCEALIEFNDSLYVFTKDWANRTTTLYQMPKQKGTYKITPIQTFNVSGLITGADISPDKSKLALVGYENYKPILWLFSDFEGNNFFEGKKTHIEMGAIFNAQTEGVCFLGNDSLLISCERSTSFLQQIFLIDLENIK